MSVEIDIRPSEMEDFSPTHARLPVKSGRLKPGEAGPATREPGGN